MVSLANAVLHFRQNLGVRDFEDAEAVMFYTQSVHNIKDGLSDPAKGVTEASIGTTIGFACYDVWTT